MTADKCAQGLAALAVGLLLLWVSARADADTMEGEGGQNEGFDLEGAWGAWYGVQNMVAGKRMSAQGLAALQQREGLRLQVYLDTAGKPTIGYGHLVGALENFDNGITEDQAALLLASDVATAENAVAALVAVPLTQSQFDALVSFTFNAGVSAFKNSTLLQVLNAGDYDGAAQQMARWVYVTRGGQKVVDAGLQNRRGSEIMQFATV